LIEKTKQNKTLFFKVQPISLVFYPKFFNLDKRVQKGVGTAEKKKGTEHNT